MYTLSIKPEADRIFKHLKDRKQLQIINKKILDICENPHDYKFLRKPLQGFNRAHIDSHFVLIFKIDHQKRNVTIYYYDHHDSVYRWRPTSTA